MNHPLSGSAPQLTEPSNISFNVAEHSLEVVLDEAIR